MARTSVRPAANAMPLAADDQIIYVNPSPEHPGQPLSLGCEGASLYTIPEAAARLRVCPRTIWRLIKRGTGPPILRICRKVFIRHDDLERWMLSHTQAPTARASSSSLRP